MGGQGVIQEGNGGGGGQGVTQVGNGGGTGCHSGREGGDMVSLR
jgi:hypothetical protein